MECIHPLAKLRGLDTPSEGSEGFFLVYIMSNANPYGEFLNSGGLPCKTLTMKKLAHHPHLIFNLFQYGAGFCALREPPITLSKNKLKIKTIPLIYFNAVSE